MTSVYWFISSRSLQSNKIEYLPEGLFSNLLNLKILCVFSFVLFFVVVAFVQITEMTIFAISLPLFKNGTTMGSICTCTLLCHCFDISSAVCLLKKTNLLLRRASIWDESIEFLIILNLLRASWKLLLAGNILYVVRYRTVIHLYSYDCGVVFGPNLVRLDLLCFGTFSVGVNLHTFNYVHINLTAVKLTTKSHNCISFLRETSYRSLTNCAKSTRCYSPPSPSTFYWTFKRFLGEFRYLSTGIFKTC